MKIVAIGGGEIGRPGTKIETLSLDKEVVRLSGKKHPKLLFLPTASGDSKGYAAVVKKYYGKKLGCRVQTLYLINNKFGKDKIRKLIFSSDIIYVGGGNTLKMLRVWKKYSVDKLLVQAYKKGVILSGLSAGAICWFKYGLSDSRRFAKNKDDFAFMRISGLGIIPCTVSPHHIREK